MVVRTKKAAPKTPGNKGNRAASVPRSISKASKSAPKRAKKAKPNRLAGVRRALQPGTQPAKTLPPMTATAPSWGEITQLRPPSASVQRIALRPGHYALRHLGFAPGIVPQNRLPFATVQILAGEATLSDVTGAAVPVLRQPNDTVMIIAGARGAELLIVSFNHPNAQGPGFRFMLSPLALPSVADGSVGTQSTSVQPSVSTAPAFVQAQPPPPAPHIVAIGHSEKLGDVSYGAGEWIGGAGNVSLRLEGFILHMRGAAPGLALEYGIADELGHLTWAREGTLAGSRGRARPAYGIAARLMGAMANQWRILYECRFAGVRAATTAQNGNVCLSRERGAFLTGVRFLLSRSD